MSDFTILAVVSATVSATILFALSANCCLKEGEATRAFLVYFIVAFGAALLTGFVEIPLTRYVDRYCSPATYACVPAAINLFAGRFALKIIADDAPPKTVRAIVLAFTAIKFALTYFANILLYLGSIF